MQNLSWIVGIGFGAIVGLLLIIYDELANIRRIASKIEEELSRDEEDEDWPFGDYERQ